MEHPLIVEVSEPSLISASRRNVWNTEVGDGHLPADDFIYAAVELAGAFRRGGFCTTCERENFFKDEVSEFYTYTICLPVATPPRVFKQVNRSKVNQS